MKKNLLKLTLFALLLTSSGCATHFSPHIHSKTEGKITILDNQKEGYAYFDADDLAINDQLEVLEEVCKKEKVRRPGRLKKVHLQFVCKDVPVGKVLITSKEKHLVKIKAVNDLTLQVGFIVKRIK